MNSFFRVPHILFLLLLASSLSSSQVVNISLSTNPSEAYLGETTILTAEIELAASTECGVYIDSETFTRLNVTDPVNAMYDNRHTSVFIDLGTISSSQTIYLDAVVIRALPINGNIVITMVVGYGSYDAVLNKYMHSMPTSTSILYLGPEIEPYMTTDEEVIPGTIPFDKEQELLVEIILPQTTLTSVDITLSFMSADFTYIPVDASFAEINSNSSDVLIDSYNTTSFTVEHSTYSTPARRRLLQSVAQVDVTWTIGDIQNIATANAALTFKMYYTLSQTSETVAGNTLDYYLFMDLNGGKAVLDTYDNLAIAEPELVVIATIEALEQTRETGNYIQQVMRFNVSVEHSLQSNANAYSVILTYPLSGLGIYYYDGMYPPYRITPGLTIQDNVITLTQDVLAVGDTMFLSFKAFFDSNSLMLNTGLASVYTVTVTSESLPADLVTLENPGRQYTVSDTACVNKVEEQETSYLYNTGAGALAFFICLIIALVLVALFFLIWIKVLKKTPPFSVVEPDMKASKHGQGRGLIMNAKDAMKTGFNAIKEYSIIAIDESIVYILTLKDKLSIYRELDNLDVLATITVDIELEIQRIDMMIESVLYLVQSLRMNKDITKQVEDKCISKFQRNIKDLNKKLNDEYRLESATLIKRLSSQNKGKLYQLHKKHEVEKEEAKDKTKGMTDDERKDLMDLIDKQHQAEENELTHLLKLEQDEEQEKLRKEFAIRKRMAVKAIQHQLLDDVKTEGNLTEEQADWLMKQHKKNMNTLEKFMDDEISRQRMLLDEKLARRRALAESKEDQEDYHRDVLNTMATQQMGMVQTLAKNERLTEAQAEEMLARIQKDLLALKKKFDNEQTRQDEALHKRLSELKKRRIEQKEREHKQELADLEKKQKIKSQNGNVDPQGYIEAKEHLLSQQRGELNDLENQLDEDAAKELEQVRAQHVKKVQHDIKNSSDKLCKELGNKAGLDEEMKNEIMAQHERDLEKLLETREEERSKHERILKKRLAKNRKEWAKRKEVEKEEQQKIREHEEQMVGRLMATQVVMSNADRDKILQEHEKQLVKLENSLTLNKLRQKRKLEEKMSAKKAKQLEKLEKRQHQESQRQKRRQQLADSDNDEDFAQAQQEMMTRHAEEKINLLTNQKAKMTDELEQVHIEMMEERARTLKEQEERLGAMVAKLQMEKARELATIEDQQKALVNLKMNMMGELTDTGILSNQEGKKIIQEHQKEVEKLEGKLNAQRQKQEKELKKRLRDKLSQREKSFQHLQEEQLRHVADGQLNNLAAKIRIAALKHKQMMELEEFRRNMEVEIGQTLEDLRRSYEVKRLQLLQEQEIDFIASLVRHGGYEKNELQGILLLLFPNKSDEQIREVLERIYKATESDDDIGDVGSRKRKTKAGTETLSLEDRVKAALIKDIPDSSLTRTKMKGLLKGKNKKVKLAPLNKQQINEGYDDDDDYDNSFHRSSKLPDIPHQRPDPVGRTSTPDNLDRDMRRHYIDSEDEIDDYFEQSSRPVPRPRARDDANYTY